MLTTDTDILSPRPLHPAVVIRLTRPVFLILPYRVGRLDQLDRSVWKSIGGAPRLCLVVLEAEIFPPSLGFSVGPLPEEAGV